MFEDVINSIYRKLNTEYHEQKSCMHISVDEYLICSEFSILYAILYALLYAA
jgi:hypothetical protein